MPPSSPGSTELSLREVTHATCFNPIRKGSIATDESVIDLASGRQLSFEQVSGAEARKAGLATADPEGEYIKVQLARPVHPQQAARRRRR